MEKDNEKNVQANKLLFLIVAKRVNEIMKQNPTMTEEQAREIAIDELLDEINKNKNKK